MEQNKLKHHRTEWTVQCTICSLTFVNINILVQDYAKPLMSALINVFEFP